MLWIKSRNLDILSNWLCNLNDNLQELIYKVFLVILVRGITIRSGKSQETLN